MFKQLLDVQVGDVYASFLVVVAVLAAKCSPNIVQLMLCLTQFSNILNTYVYCGVNKSNLYQIIYKECCNVTMEQISPT